MEKNCTRQIVCHRQLFEAVFTYGQYWDNDRISDNNSKGLLSPSSMFVNSLFRRFSLESEKLLMSLSFKVSYFLQNIVFDLRVNCVEFFWILCNASHNKLWFHLFEPQQQQFSSRHKGILLKFVINYSIPSLLVFASPNFFCCYINLL